MTVVNANLPESSTKKVGWWRYFAYRLRDDALRSHTEPDLPGRCPRCYLKVAVCLCADVPSVDTRFEVVILRHAREATKSTNTGRIAALALKRCRIIRYGGREDDFDGALGPLHEPWLVFPDDHARLPTSLPGTLIFLDGTWRQASRMAQRLSSGRLRGVPRLSLPAPTIAPARLRQSPNSQSLSTLEAIATAVGMLEGEAKATPLHSLHALLVERVLRGRGVRTPSCSD